MKKYTVEFPKELLGDTYDKWRIIDHTILEVLKHFRENQSITIQNTDCKDDFETTQCSSTGLWESFNRYAREGKRMTLLQRDW